MKKEIKPKNSMLLSEFISELQKIKDSQGDLPVIGRFGKSRTTPISVAVKPVIVVGDVYEDSLLGFVAQNGAALPKKKVVQIK